MKRLLLLVFWLYSLNIFAQFQQPQVYQDFRAIVTVLSATNTSGNNYTIRFNAFQDPTQFFTVGDIQTKLTAGNKLWLWTRPKVNGLNCQRYLISAITPTGIGQYDLTVTNPDNTGFNGMPQEGVGNPIYEHLQGNDMPMFISSQPTLSGFINPNIQTCIETHVRHILANTVGGVDTLTFNVNGTTTRIATTDTVRLNPIEMLHVIRADNTNEQITDGDTILTIVNKDSIWINGNKIYQLSVGGNIDSITIPATAIDKFVTQNELLNIGGGNIVSKITMSDASILSDTLNIYPTGTFASDAAAATGGIALGEEYYLSTPNVYGMAAGMRRKRLF